jgi:acyl carrier protein
MTTFTHLCRYINQQFTLPISGIKSVHRLQKDLGLNDIEVTEVVVFMELLYGLTLPDEALTPSLSVIQLCTLIEQHMDKEQADSAFLVYRNHRHVFSKAS